MTTNTANPEKFEANALYLETKIPNKSVSLTELLGLDKPRAPELRFGIFINPDEYLQPGDITKFQDLFLEHRKHDYQILEPNEKALFWAHGFFHGYASFNKLFRDTVESFSDDPKRAEWIWKTILQAEQYKTIDSHPSQHVLNKFWGFKDLETMRCAMINNFVRPTVQELKTPHTIARKTIISHLLLIDPSTLDENMVMDFFKYTNRKGHLLTAYETHPIVIATYLQRYLQINKDPLYDQATALFDSCVKKIDYFLTHFITCFDVSDEAFKNVVTSVARLVQKIGAPGEEKLKLLLQFREACVSWAQKSSLYKDAHWMHYHDRTAQREDDSFRFFLEKFLDSINYRHMRSDKLQLFLKLDSTKPLHGELLLAIAEELELESPLDEWLCQSSFGEAIKIAGKSKNPSGLYRLASKKDEWTVMNWEDAEKILQTTRSQELLTGYLEGPKAKDVPFNIWLMTSIAGFKLPF